MCDGRVLCDVGLSVLMSYGAVAITRALLMGDMPTLQLICQMGKHETS